MTHHPIEEITETLHEMEPTHEEPQLQGAPRGSIPRRVACYGLGLFILALSVSLSVKSNLGVSPVNSLPYVISELIGWDMGLVTAALFTCYVGLQALLLRGEFQLKSLLQIAVGMLFGAFVSVTGRLLAFDTPDAYFMRMAFSLVSVVFVALGLTLILAADIVPQPPEGLMLAIEMKTGWKFSNIKIGFDCTVVALAILLGFIFRGQLMGAREGTVIAAVCVGMVMALLKKTIGGFLDRVLLIQR